MLLNICRSCGVVNCFRTNFKSIFVAACPSHPLSMQCRFKFRSDFKLKRLDAL